MAGDETATIAVADGAAANGVAAESIVADLFGDKQAFAGGEPVADVLSDGGQLDGDAGEQQSDTESQQADPLAAIRETPEFKAEVRRLKRGATESLRRDFTQAIKGDAGAIKALENDRDGRAMWREYQQSVTEQAAQAGQNQTIIRDTYSQIAQMSVYDREELHRTNKPLWDWFYRDDIQAIGQGAAYSPVVPRQQMQAEPGEALQAEYDDWMADENAALLTDDEKESFHPSEYDDLAPADAVKAMRKQARRVLADAARREARKPVRDRAAQVNQRGQVVADAIAAAPPIVGGAPPAMRSERTVEAEWAANYRAGTLTPQLDREWKSIQAARQQRAGSWTP